MIPRVQYLRSAGSVYSRARITTLSTRQLRTSRGRRLSIRAAIVLATAFIGILTGCARSAPQTGLARLHPCATSEGPTDALCGVLQVYENRKAGSGRRLSLHIVALPSLAPEAAPDPLFFLAGGPGQAAAQMATEIREIFRPVLRQRDIILVDQRGTGKSHPLECRNESNSLQELTESNEGALGRLRKCLHGYDADVRLYTTTIAMDDLDDVRAHLGYERINLYGGSYGTRAALVYLRQHGDRVRSMILDGVAPTDMRLPLYSARDAQRALDKLLADCEADTPCRMAHPGLAERVRALLLRLEAAPPRVRMINPRTGVDEEVVVEARIAASILFGALYSPLTASLVPTLIADAEQNDFTSLFALAYAGDGASDNMSVGMQLSVLCSEDASRVTAADVAREAAGTLFSTHLFGGQLKACEMWPKGRVDEAYYQPVASDVPTLILSGDADPVTPPGWGDAVARHLPNARHVAVPATGHGVVGTPCGQRLIREFLQQGTTTGLDTACITTVQRPPFFVTPAGPDPEAGN